MIKYIKFVLVALFLFSSDINALRIIVKDPKFYQIKKCIVKLSSARHSYEMTCKQFIGPKQFIFHDIENDIYDIDVEVEKEFKGQESSVKFDKSGISLEKYSTVSINLQKNAITNW